MTIGFQLGYREQDYGLLLDNNATIGCGFVTKGLVDVTGSFTSMYPRCGGAVARWRQEAQRFHPKVVLVEMGWWDSMDHLWNSQDVHLGQAAYDRDVLSGIVSLASTLGRGGVPVVFLTVPWMNPPPWPNGSAPPAASPLRHQEINSLLRQAMHELAAHANLFDLAPYVTPDGFFQADVGGEICRSSDGVHFYYGGSLSTFVPTTCGDSLRTGLFPYLRRLLDSSNGDRSAETTMVASPRSVDPEPP